MRSFLLPFVTFPLLSCSLYHISASFTWKHIAPAARIMVLVDKEDEQGAFATIMAGAQGYWSKQDVDPDDIMGMIRMLYRGDFVIRHEMLTRLMFRLRSAAMPLLWIDSLQEQSDKNNIDD